jgi:hypothetical protein
MHGPPIDAGGPDGATPTAPPRPTRRELRQFAFAVGGAFLALAAAAVWRGHPGRAALAAAVGAPLAAAGALVPGRLGPAYRAWMGLALAMSRVTTPVFMGVIYFGLVTPTGVLRRLAGRGTLGAARGAPSAWVDRPPGARRGDLRRQF